MHGGDYKWPLPNGGPGDWTKPLTAPLVMCERGYHVLRDDAVLSWLGPRIFETEYTGESIEAWGKICAHSVRLLREFGNWNARTSRLFACDCAERALAQAGANDERSKIAIQVARRFAQRQATIEELCTARLVADEAASRAPTAVQGAMRAAAYVVCNSASRAAANASVCARMSSLASDKERSWQFARLMQYLNGEAE